jgi:hypothetical protein
VAWDDGSESRVFLKRFLHPESAWVEAFSHQLLAELGIATYPVTVLERAEPIFLSAQAEGRKLGETMAGVEITPALAREIGRHICSGYLRLTPTCGRATPSPAAPASAAGDGRSRALPAQSGASTRVASTPDRAARGAGRTSSICGWQAGATRPPCAARRQFFETRGRPTSPPSARAGSQHGTRRRAASIAGSRGRLDAGCRWLPARRPTAGCSPLRSRGPAGANRPPAEEAARTLAPSARHR